VSAPGTYTAVLPAPEETVLFVSGLLAAERRRRGTRRGRRALGCYRQAVLVLRWFLDGTRLAQLAIDNAISASTAYRYLHEGIDVLAGQAPGLRGALLAARGSGPAPPPPRPHHMINKHAKPLLGMAQCAGRVPRRVHELDSVELNSRRRITREMTGASRTANR
jgi:hypothetical protein